MCEIRPPVTLWGTTQIKTFTTILTTVSDQVSTITKETIVTNVIPVQTRSYPCTSTAPPPSASSTPTPTSSPEPEPQLQPSSEVEVTTSRAPVSSPSPSVEISRVLGGETDSLTVELSPSRTLSTTTTIKGTSSSIVLQTIEPSPTPTDDPTVIHETDTEPILSASSLFTDADHPDSTAGAALASSSDTQTVLPIGAIVGIILAALLVLSLLGFFIWTRKNKKDRDAEGDGDPYWERRFQQLESVQSQSKPRLDTVQSPDDDEGTWRRHLTMNLGSYHPVIARPASRLSQISSFFGQSQQSQTHTSPQTRRLSLVNETQSQEEIDFSQPLADKWSLTTPTNAGHGHGQNRPASSKSNRSRIGSRKSNSDSEKLTGRRSSAWPFSAIAAALSGNKARVEGVHRNGSIEGRRGMEWIRTIVSSDSGFGFNHDTNRDPSSSNRGLPPPPRRGVSPMALNNLQTTNRGLYLHPHNHDDVHSPNPTSPDLVSPNPPPSYVTQSDSDGGTLSPRTEGSSPRQLAPSNSLRRKRVNKGLPVPDLALARDAISPSLWVDEDTLDRLEDRNQLPPLPMTSVAPLAISNRHLVPPPLPALPKTGPSAFPHNPDLISKFSPDSSRASFATTHDGRQSVPAPPVPERDLHTYKVEDIPPSRRETDGDSIATRRYDRSAVTPQLPTLATSNADAFRQEMAEILASTGEDREERVISFHGGRK